MPFKVVITSKLSTIIIFKIYQSMSPPQKLFNAVLTGDVEYFTGAETIETGCGANGICSHVFEIEPIADLEYDGEDE
jgi:hypothetical protein